MTIPLTRAAARTTPWVLPILGIALGWILLQPGRQVAYLSVLTVATTAAAAWIAAEDYRTGLLRNRWTAPLALAGLIQVIVASISARSWIEVASPCLIGAAVTTALYFLLGLLGWVGFGDVKFAAGLALFVAIPAGWGGLYLLPLALILSATARLVRQAASRTHHLRSAHGPALAAALALLMTAGCIGHI